MLDNNQPDSVSIGKLNIGIFESQSQVISILLNQLNAGIPLACVSVNAEVAIDDVETGSLRKTLKPFDILVADGIGVVKAIRYKYGIKIPRLPGCEIWEKLMSLSSQNNLSVYLVGARSEVVNATAKELVSLYSTNVVGVQHGYFVDEDKVVQDILGSGAKIVSVALGSPRQERFIEKCRDAGIVAIYMGVGGTYDVFTGHLRRAPKIFQKLNLEWLYRLIQQPTRIARQLNLIRFLFFLILRKL